MLEVKGISKKYGKNKVLDDVEFTLKPGEKVCLVGRNGCGKTTLLQILAGCIKPDKGQIAFFGNDPLADRKYFKKMTGYVPQESFLIPELTVLDNMKLWGTHGCENYEYLLDRFELRDILKTGVSRLSGGMKKRVGIACALSSWPPILLLDEPTSSLDIYYKETISEWISEFQNLNGIILWSTHEEAEILSTDRCLLLKDGHILSFDTDKDIMARIREKL